MVHPWFILQHLTPFAIRGPKRRRTYIHHNYLISILNLIKSYFSLLVVGDFSLDGLAPLMKNEKEITSKHKLFLTISEETSKN